MRKALIGGVVALVVAALGLALAFTTPATAERTGNDDSSGVSTRNLGV